MTILNETFVDTAPSFAMVIIVPLILFSFMALIGFLKDETRIGLCIGGGMAAFALCVLLLLYFGVIGKKYTKIETLLDDKISYVEVEDKYELLERRGDIYVFRVKEEVNE